jgi:hypothetical protein
MTKRNRRPAFVPARPRSRHDGWTPERQVDFVTVLAETGSVADACRAVGMTRSSAYALKARVDAAAFRAAWESALHYAVDRIADAVTSRAIHGVAVPHFYQGQQVGEHRRYDERLAMFLLRVRDPARFGKQVEQHDYDYAPGMLAHEFLKSRNLLLRTARGSGGGREPARFDPATKSEDGG